MGIGVQVCHTAAVKYCDRNTQLKKFLMKIISAGLTSLKVDTVQLVCIVELKELWFILGDRSKF